MSYATHCDAESCDSWQRTDSEFLPFLELSEGEELVGNFCTLDCLMKWAAANSWPTETVEL